MSACDLGCGWAAELAGLQRVYAPDVGALTASEGGIECLADHPHHRISSREIPVVH